MMIFFAILVPVCCIALGVAVAALGRGSFRLGFTLLRQTIRARHEGGLLYVQHQVFRAVWSGITRSLSGEPLIIKEVQLFVPAYLRAEVEQAREAIAAEVIREVHRCRSLLSEDGCLRGDDPLECPRNHLHLEFDISSSTATNKLTDVRAKVVVSDACPCVRRDYATTPYFEVYENPDFYDADGHIGHLGLA